MDLTFRYNPEKDDVEIVADDNVIDTVGTDVFSSWVSAYNDKHGFVQRVETPAKEEEKPKEETKDSAKDSDDKVDESKED